MSAPPELIAHLLDGAPFRSNQIHERDRWLIEEAYKAGASQNLKPCLVTDLSPAAQAVMDAFYTEADRLNREATEEEMIAAALRAAAYQVVPPDPLGPGRWDAMDEIRASILAIAAELEGAR